jgi:hypothetical protein
MIARRKKPTLVEELPRLDGFEEWRIAVSEERLAQEAYAAEEPLKADLDVARLKAEVLERIEELEEGEREREEILSKLVPAMEARGYDTGAVKAVMGG